MSEPNHINLYPELDDELDAVYAQAEAQQGSMPGIADVVASALKTGNALHDYDHLFAEKVQATRDRMAELYSHAKIRTPTIEEFKEAGINFKMLADTNSSVEAHGKSTSLVIAPVISPMEWETVYESLARDTTFADATPVSLRINSTFKDTDWYELQDSGHGVTAAGLSWDVFLIVEEDGEDVVAANINKFGESYEDPDRMLTLKTAYTEAGLVLPTTQEGKAIMPTIGGWLAHKADQLLTGDLALDSLFGERILNTYLYSTEPRGFTPSGFVGTDGVITIGPEYDGLTPSMHCGANLIAWGDEA